MALAVPLSRFTSQVGGGSAFFVRLHDYTTAIESQTVYRGSFVFAARDVWHFYFHAIIYRHGFTISLWQYLLVCVDDCHVAGRTLCLYSARRPAADSLFTFIRRFWFILGLDC